MQPSAPETFGLVDATSLPAYDLGPGHPFARDRQQPLTELLHAMALVRPEEFLRPEPAPERSLELGHAPDYVAMVAASSVPDPDMAVRREALAFGLGSADNPLAPGQHVGASAITGGTLACVEGVVAGELRHAFNPTGGLHHAGHRAASGFCIYNDLVVGIARARELGMGRVMYVDFDVHHGDGVEFAFSHDPNVATVSFHQSPETLFPGTGLESDMGHGDARGTVVNVPFAPYTDDESWWQAVSTILPAFARRFQPDFILTQHGCDPHREDPLAQLILTTEPMRKAAQLCRELADELCEGRWVATGGGGYQPLRVVPRAWSLVWSEVCKRPLPETIDKGWIRAWQDKSELTLSPTFLDPAAPPTNSSRTAHDQNRHRLDRLWGLHDL